MTYLSSIDARNGRPLAQSASEPAAAAEIGFTELEWSVIRLAQLDRLWTIRKQGPVRRAWNKLIGRGNPELANPRLEALRRISVLSWHYGFTVPGEDVAAFVAAGFSERQYELLVTNVGRWARGRSLPHLKAELA